VPVPTTGDRAFLLWHDDNESGGTGWTHGDNTATAIPRFHVDTYYTWQGGTYSYWCGELNPNFTGGDGYGNGWDERLVLPPLDLGSPPAVYPVLTFRYRHDCEPDYDYTYVQAESTGHYVNLNRGYDGLSGGWQDIGVYGYVLLNYDSPLAVRFRFISDAAYSDEDAVYDSDGGAFHVDDIQVFDYYGGHVYFFDDVENGVGQCTSVVPQVAGDYWHLVEKRCSASSDPHCWWCGDDADTTLIPPGLDNWLMTPVIDLAGAFATTLRFILHAEVPMVDDDHWTEEITMDGGDIWYHSGTYWGVELQGDIPRHRPRPLPCAGQQVRVPPDHAHDRQRMRSGSGRRRGSRAGRRVPGGIRVAGGDEQLGQAEGNVQIGNGDRDRNRTARRTLRSLWRGDNKTRRGLRLEGGGLFHFVWNCAHSARSYVRCSLLRNSRACVTYRIPGIATSTAMGRMRSVKPTYAHHPNRHAMPRTPPMSFQRKASAYATKTPNGNIASPNHSLP
jgi:hypothetical protein